MVGGIQPYPSTIMKNAILTCLALSLCFHSLHAEDSLNDQLRRAAEKLKNEFSKVKEQGEIKGREWFKKAREHVTTSRTEYLQQAGAALTLWTLEAAVEQAQEEAGL